MGTRTKKATTGRRLKPPSATLADSSVAMAALGYSTKAHHVELKKKLGTKKLSRTVFLRKEFVWRLVKDAFWAADAVVHFDDASDALVWLSQEFGSRPSKNLLTLIATILRKRRLGSGRDLATEFTRIGDDLLCEYDLRFGDSVHNNAGCEIGDTKLVVDYRRPHRAQQFLEGEVAGVEDCAAVKIIDQQAVAAILADKSKDRLKKNAVSPFKCVRCRRIGDYVIAFETRDSDTVFACDNELVTIGTTLNKTFIYIESVRAVEGKASDWSRDNG